jgi:hypothetical protein
MLLFSGRKLIVFTLNRQGVLCKIAFGWPLGRDVYPKQTNLCSFFWRLLASFFIVWPLIFITLTGGWVIRIAGAPIAFILFGYKPAGPDWRLLDEMESHGVPFPFTRIKRWPKVGGAHFQLFWVLFAVFFVWLISALAYGFVWKLLIQEVFLRGIYSTTYGRTSFWSLVCLATFAIIYAIIKDKELWRMTKAGVAGIKEKYCPIVAIK